jgi:insertion element IS1 protein InsB
VKWTSSWVGNKRQQIWLFYGFDTKRKKVLAHVFGPRTAGILKRLLHLLKEFSIGMFTTDGWPSYESQISQCKHLVGKICTQRIERHNLTLRTHIKRLARRTICFSKSVELHEKVIGAYIYKYHHKSLLGTTQSGYWVVAGSLLETHCVVE